MNKELANKIVALLKDEEVSARVGECRSYEEAYEVLSPMLEGEKKEEVLEAFEAIQDKLSEISDVDLNSIAGGAACIFAVTEVIITI